MVTGNSAGSNQHHDSYPNTIAELKRFVKLSNLGRFDQLSINNKLDGNNDELIENKLRENGETIDEIFLNNEEITPLQGNSIEKLNQIIDSILKQKIQILHLELDEYLLQNKKLNQSLTELKEKSKNNGDQSLIPLINEINNEVIHNGKQTTDVVKLQVEFENLLAENIKNQIESIIQNLEEAKKDYQDKIKFLQDEINQKAIKLNQSERLSAIGELTSRVAHDLRNPLSVMKGSIDLLKIKNKIDFDESRSRHYEIMDRAINRMSAQIEDVLDFIRPIPLKVSENHLLETIKSSMEKAKISQRIDVELPQTDVCLEYDDKKMDVVFDNLLTNAKQAIEGKGKISIKIEETENSVSVKIVDSGPGIHKDIIESIFDPLVTTKQTGTGLGLASCLRIVQDHGGNISVTNNPTTFTITLPKRQKTSSEHS